MDTPRAEFLHPSIVSHSRRPPMLYLLIDHFRPRKRVLPHASVQEHLAGRYYLPPSLLYSVIRLSRDNATYDIPVEGDWLTIAVVAERGEVRVSGTKGHVESDSEDEAGPSKPKIGDRAQGEGEGDVKEKWRRRRGPRKYINLKLCALPPRSKTISGPSGDALLQLLLFEADAVVRTDPGEEGEVRRSYRGGSGGAYERWCNLSVGSVVAILNPRVLRPLKVRLGRGRT